jgi:hypothetical protein
VFDPVQDFGRWDYRLMAYSPVRVIHDLDLMDKVLTWLKNHDYRLIVLDGSWTITEHMFRDIGSVLGGLCHDNWQCLSEAFAEFLGEAFSDTDGVVIALTGFDEFVDARFDDANTFVSLLGENSWRSAVRGHRLLWLLQTNRLQLFLRPGAIWTGPIVTRSELQLGQGGAG